MRRKLLLLGAVLAMCGMPLLTSCSKDDEPKRDEVVIPTVVGSKWRFHDDYLGTIVLVLRADGSFETNVIGNTTWWFEGYYMQDGVSVRFNITNDEYVPLTFYLGTLSEDGNTLTVPIYDKPWDDLFYTVEFVRMNG